MSEGMKDQKIFPVPVHHTSLVTISRNDAPTERFPMIGVWTSILDFDNFLISSKDISTGVPAYVISDIIVENPESLYVRIVFTRYVDGNVPSVNFSILLPIHYLAILQSLQFAPDGFYLAIFDERIAQVDEYRPITIQEVAIFVQLPPIDSHDSHLISEKMGEIVSSFYTNPLVSNDPEADDDGFDYSSAARKAQQFLFTTLAGIALGDVASLRRFINMEEWIRRYATAAIEGQESSTEDEEHDDFIDNIISILRSVMDASNMSINLDVDESEVKISPIGSSDHDEEFMSLMNDSGLANTLVDIGATSRGEGSEILRQNAQAYSVHRPFASGYPEKMKPIFDYISSNDDLSSRMPLWEEDFSEKSIDLHNGNPIEEIMTAYVIVLAGRVLRYLSALAIKTGNEESALHPSFILAQWLTAPQDTYMWEITSAAPTLQKFETLQFSDLLCATQPLGTDPRDAHYMVHVLHAIGHQILSEEWTSQSLIDALDNAEVKTIAYPSVRSVFSIFTEELIRSSQALEQESDAPCPSYAGVISVINSEIFSIETLANAISTIIPMLADIQAEKRGLSVGSEDWNKFRLIYISELLKSVASKTERRFAR